MAISSSSSYFSPSSSFIDIQFIELLKHIITIDYRCFCSYGTTSEGNGGNSSGMRSRRLRGKRGDSEGTSHGGIRGRMLMNALLLHTIKKETFINIKIHIIPNERVGRIKIKLFLVILILIVSFEVMLESVIIG